MSELGATFLLGGGAMLCLLLHFGLSVALASASTLSHVALRRLGKDHGEKFAFMQGLAEPTSVYRLAASANKQNRPQFSRYLSLSALQALLQAHKEALQPLEVTSCLHRNTAEVAQSEVAQSEEAKGPL